VFPLKSALTQIPKVIEGMLRDYKDDLEQAWANLQENESLNIGLSAKVGFDKKGIPACEVGISFVKEKVKDSVTFNWDDKQENLFKMVKGIDDHLKKDHTSMTIKGDDGTSVTLGSPINQTVPDSELPEDTNEFYTRARERKQMEVEP
jgi:hypothetical protein